MWLSHGISRATKWVLRSVLQLVLECLHPQFVTQFMHKEQYIAVCNSVRHNRSTHTCRHVLNDLQQIQDVFHSSIHVTRQTLTWLRTQFRDKTTIFIQYGGDRWTGGTVHIWKCLFMSPSLIWF